MRSAYLVLDLFVLGHLLGFGLVNLVLTSVQVCVVGEVQFVHVVLVLDLVLHRLYFAVAHALLTTGFG